MRDAALAVLRRRGLTTIFANPGSTEVDLLVDLPDDLDFVLGLHEGSVVGMATGYATATRRPSLVLLHTTAGLGNAVGALATARANRVPLVVLVGQQDRRHLAARPFLAGDLDGLAGQHPVWSSSPTRPADVPAALDRAWHEARLGRGPALVVVPSDDWGHDADPDAHAAPSTLRRGDAPGQDVVDELAAALAGAAHPALVVGADADSPAAWTALTALAERLHAPVWQEAFAARAGFPQDHPCFAGHLPPGRAGLRGALAGHDVVLVVGAPVFRQYLFEPGPLTASGTTVLLVTDDPEDAAHGPVDLAVLAEPAATVTALLAALDSVLDATSGPAPDDAAPPRDGRPDRRPGDALPGAGAPLRAAPVLAALADRLPRDAVLVEETPSSRSHLHRLVPARAPLGFLSAAQGGLGFGVPAAIGVRMGAPDRPVLAVVGDGSSLYGIQALWSAAHYRVGVLVVVLANGRYAIMDRLAARAGGTGPWPAFPEVDVAAIAVGLGCTARRVGTADELVAVLDETLPGLAGRSDPLVLVVDVEP